MAVAKRKGKWKEKFRKKKKTGIFKPNKSVKKLGVKKFKRRPFFEEVSRRQPLHKRRGLGRGPNHSNTLFPIGEVIVYKRAGVITSELIGKDISVHNGNKFTNFKVSIFLCRS